MALIKCYECGSQISDRAISCPHCGAPVEADVHDSQSVCSQLNPVDETKVVQEKKSNGFAKAGIIMAILSISSFITLEVAARLLGDFYINDNIDYHIVKFIRIIFSCSIFVFYILALIFSIIGLCKQPKKQAIVSIILCGAYALFGLAAVFAA